MEEFESSIERGPNVKWFKVSGYDMWTDEGLWIYKNNEIRMQIGGNEQSGYKSLINRVCNGIRITGPSWTTSNLELLKKLCEQEFNYINSVIVPNRDTSNLGELKKDEEAVLTNRLNRIQ